MGDLISRQAAIEKAKELVANYRITTDAMTIAERYIQDIPSAREWILCSERLPEKCELVLTTIRGTDLIVLEDGETFEQAVERCNKQVRVSVGFIGSDGWYGAEGLPEIVTPCAWMPLPEPWRGEEE